MASKWLRGIMIDSGNATYWTNYWKKAYALWLNKIMEFSVVEDSCGGGNSWFSTEKNGSNGSFSGSSFTFTENTTAPFALSDVDKFIVINDNTNYINAGIYRVVQYISTTQVVIDYQAGFDEYPLASTGLSWWLFGPNYQIPTTNGDHAVLASNHTDNWEIKLISVTDYSKLLIKIAPEGNWSKSLPDVGSNNWYEMGLGINTDGRTVLSFWAEGDYTSHDNIHLWAHVCTGRSVVQLLSVEHISPIEAGQSEAELIAIKGYTNFTAVTSDTAGGRAYNGNINPIYVWSDRLNSPVVGFCLDYTLSGRANNFLESNSYWEGREVNRRLDYKKEIYQGTLIVIDENNVRGGYQLLGKLTGHWSIPMMAYSMNQSTYYGYDGMRHHMMPLTKDSTGDLLLLCQDIAVPWCNLSIRGFGL